MSSIEEQTATFYLRFYFLTFILSRQSYNPNQAVKQKFLDDHAYVFKGEKFLQTILTSEQIEQGRLLKLQRKVIMSFIQHPYLFKVPRFLVKINNDKNLIL